MPSAIDRILIAEQLDSVGHSSAEVSVFSQFVEIEAVLLGNQLLSLQPITPMQRTAPAFVNTGNDSGDGTVKGCGHNKKCPTSKACDFRPLIFP